MKIDFLAHASFLFINEEGHRFMIDPYELGGFSRRVDYSPVDVSPDVIMITHDHLDHNHTETIPENFEIIRHEGTVDVNLNRDYLRVKQTRVTLFLITRLKHD